MKQLSATKRVLLGLVIGLVVAAIGIGLYCFAWGVRFALGDLPMPSDAESTRTGLLRFGFVMYGILVGPIGATLGVVGGTATFLLRRHLRQTAPKLR